MREDAVETLILGASPVIRELRRVIKKIAPERTPVLIQGPTGSGKELVAQSIHSLSGREGSIVAFNVSAISEGMVEDTLFGHRKGAFSGAYLAHTGLVTEAHRGTLFLDEVGTLALALQVKLLRVLETGAFRPVGASSDARSDFRLVSATNESLDRLVQRGAFRADLLYRIRGFQIEVPSLKVRKEDIEILALHFCELLGSRRQHVPKLLPRALDVLSEHDWPGNVRELRYAVEAAAILAPAGVIDLLEVERAIRMGQGGSRFVSSAPDHAGREKLLEVLERFDWDVSRAAGELGIHRVSAYRLIRRRGIVLPGRASSRLSTNGSPPSSAEVSPLS
jgi:DNA-binding NtrC family response regulator